MAAAAKPAEKGTPDPAAKPDEKPVDKPAEGKTGDEGKPAAAGKPEKKPAEGDGATKPESTDGEGETKPKAPEKYALTVPTGDTAHVDATELKTLEAIARANDLTNEQAQQLLEDHIAEVKAEAKRHLDTLTADQTYGGEKLAETQKLARLAIDKIRPEGHARRAAFTALLEKGGIGNHIEVVSYLADLGRLFAEDSPGVTGGPTGKASQNLEDRFYKD